MQSRFVLRFSLLSPISFVVVALLLSFSSTLLAQGTQEANWPPKTFPISAWCSPPEKFISRDAYRRYASAGFTLLMPPCGPSPTKALNAKILDLARQTGLKAIIADARMPLSVKNNPTAMANIKAIVTDFKKAPALMGYFLTDEPGGSTFAELAEVAAEFKRLDPDHIVYINLFPNYASSSLTNAASQLQTNSYDEYVELFMKTLHPDLVSWDHYFMTTAGDRPGFFSNLYSVQRAVMSPEYRVPMWQIVLSVQHGSYRPLTENELRFEAIQSLAFGVSGLTYFTYWLPDDPSFTWQNAIAAKDGTPGPLYEAIKNVNKQVALLEKYIYGSIWVETFQTGKIPPDGHGPVADDTIKAVGNADLTIGVFRGAGGYLYTLITNRDYKAPASTELVINLGKRDVEGLDLLSGKWTILKTRRDSDENTHVNVEVKPAGPAMIRWK